MKARRAACTLALAVLSGCTEVGTDPDAVVALVFDALPFPGVAIGDTLRDESGAAAPLRATPVNSEGDEVPGASVTYLALDPGVTISDAGFAIGTGTTTAAVRVIAQVGTLQSRPLSLVVTPAPDSAAREGAVDTLRYVVPDAATNASAAITIRVLAGSAAEPVNVRGWIVRYSVEYRGSTVPPESTDLAWFIDPAGRRSAVDTTEADGRASRRLRVVPTGLATPDDSLLVTATVTARGSAVAGTPLRVVVPVRPQ